MERSRTQVVFGYLPGKVFLHRDGLVVETVDVSGDEMRSSSKQALLDEVDAYLRNWPPERRGGIALPSEAHPSDFRIEVPRIAQWRLWPLLMECSSCGRIHEFESEGTSGVRRLGTNPNCRVCSGRLRQLRYYSAHACGRKVPLYPQACPEHGLEHVYFEDNRSFRSSRWRCHACGGQPVRNTNFTPCRCGETFDLSSTPVMRAYTVNDTRTHHTHTVTLVDIDDPLFDALRSHQDRAQVVVASLQGRLNSVSQAIGELTTDGDDDRMTAEEWATKEQQLRELGLSEADIADLKRLQGPKQTVMSRLGDLPDEIGALARDRRLVERTAVMDRDLVPRHTLEDAAASAQRRGQPVVADAIVAAQGRLEELGISELSVSWEFPVTLAAVGYTRQVKDPGQGRLMGFRPIRGDRSDQRSQLYAVSNTTEAAIVQLDPRRVLRWLQDRGTLPDSWVQDDSVLDSEVDSSVAVLGLFGQAGGHHDSAQAVTTLVHTMAHVMLKALDDGQIGLSESTMAEWMVPETLTFALYANSMKSQSLGAMWMLLNSRSRHWADRSVDSVRVCDNDPLCHQQHEAACERCLYLAYGCRMFNEDLDRKVLSEFWRHA